MSAKKSKKMPAAKRKAKKSKSKAKLKLDALKKKIMAYLPNLKAEDYAGIDEDMPGPHILQVIRAAVRSNTLDPKAVTDLTNEVLEGDDYCEDSKGRPFERMGLSNDSYTLIVDHNEHGWKSLLIWASDNSTKEIPYRKLKK